MQFLPLAPEALSGPAMIRQIEDAMTEIEALVFQLKDQWSKQIAEALQTANNALQTAYEALELAQNVQNGLDEALIVIREALETAQEALEKAKQAQITADEALDKASQNEADITLINNEITNINNRINNVIDSINMINNNIAEILNQLNRVNHYETTLDTVDLNDYIEDANLYLMSADNLNTPPKAGHDPAFFTVRQDSDETSFFQLYNEVNGGTYKRFSTGLDFGAETFKVEIEDNNNNITYVLEVEATSDGLAEMTVTHTVSSGTFENTPVNTGFTGIYTFEPVLDGAVLVNGALYAKIKDGELDDNDSIIKIGKASLDSFFYMINGTEAILSFEYTVLQAWSAWQALGSGSNVINKEGVLAPVTLTSSATDINILANINGDFYLANSAISGLPNNIAKTGSLSVRTDTAKKITTQHFITDEGDAFWRSGSSTVVLPVSTAYQFEMTLTENSTSEVYAGILDVHADVEALKISTGSSTGPFSINGDLGLNLAQTNVAIIPLVLEANTATIKANGFKFRITAPAGSGTIDVTLAGNGTETITSGQITIANGMNLLYQSLEFLVADAKTTQNQINLTAVVTDISGGVTWSSPWQSDLYDVIVDLGSANTCSIDLDSPKTLTMQPAADTTITIADIGNEFDKFTTLSIQPTAAVALTWNFAGSDEILWTNGAPVYDLNADERLLVNIWQYKGSCLISRGETEVKSYAVLPLQEPLLNGDIIVRNVAGTGSHPVYGTAESLINLSTHMSYPEKTKVVTLTYYAQLTQGAADSCYLYLGSTPVLNQAQSAVVLHKPVTSEIVGDINTIEILLKPGETSIYAGWDGVRTAPHYENIRLSKIEYYDYRSDGSGGDIFPVDTGIVEPVLLREIKDVASDIAVEDTYNSTVDISAYVKHPDRAKFVTLSGLVYAAGSGDICLYAAQTFEGRYYRLAWPRSGGSQAFSVRIYLPAGQNQFKLGYWSPAAASYAKVYITDVEYPGSGGSGNSGKESGSEDGIYPCYKSILNNEGAIPFPTEIDLSDILPKGDVLVFGSCQFTTPDSGYASFNIGLLDNPNGYSTIVAGGSETLASPKQTVSGSFSVMARDGKIIIGNKLNAGTGLTNQYVAVHYYIVPGSSSDIAPPVSKGAVLPLQEPQLAESCVSLYSGTESFIYGTPESKIDLSPYLTYPEKIKVITLTVYIEKTTKSPTTVFKVGSTQSNKQIWAVNAKVQHEAQFDQAINTVRLILDAGVTDIYAGYNYNGTGERIAPDFYVIELVNVEYYDAVSDGTGNVITPALAVLPLQEPLITNDIELRHAFENDLHPVYGTPESILDLSSYISYPEKRKVITLTCYVQMNQSASVSGYFRAGTSANIMKSLRVLAINKPETVELMGETNTVQILLDEGVTSIYAGHDDRPTSQGSAFTYENIRLNKIEYYDAFSDGAGNVITPALAVLPHKEPKIKGGHYGLRQGNEDYIYGTPESVIDLSEKISYPEKTKVVTINVMAQLEDETGRCLYFIGTTQQNGQRGAFVISRPAGVRGSDSNDVRITLKSGETSFYCGRLDNWPQELPAYYHEIRLVNIEYYDAVSDGVGNVVTPALAVLPYREPKLANHKNTTIRSDFDIDVYGTPESMIDIAEYITYPEKHKLVTLCVCGQVYAPVPEREYEHVYIKVGTTTPENVNSVQQVVQISVPPVGGQNVSDTNTVQIVLEPGVTSFYLGWDNTFPNYGPPSWHSARLVEIEYFDAVSDGVGNVITPALAVLPMKEKALYPNTLLRQGHEDFIFGTPGSRIDLAEYISYPEKVKVATVTFLGLGPTETGVSSTNYYAGSFADIDSAFWVSMILERRSTDNTQDSDSNTFQIELPAGQTDFYIGYQESTPASGLGPSSWHSIRLNKIEYYDTVSDGTFTPQNRGMNTKAAYATFAYKADYTVPADGFVYCQAMCSVLGNSLCLFVDGLMVQAIQCAAPEMPLTISFPVSKGQMVSFDGSDLHAATDARFYPA